MASQKTNLKVGYIVVMMDGQAKRNELPLGVIIKTHPSRDGVTRKVDIQYTVLGTISRRPITEVVLLVSSEEYYMQLYTDARQGVVLELLLTPPLEEAFRNY